MRIWLLTIFLCCLALTNQNLEAQAQAIFKSWFVDFEPFQDGRFVDSELGPIPEGWRVGTLKDIAQITMGQSPSGESYNDVGDGCVFFQGRAEFGNRFPTRRLFTTSPKRMAQVGDVLLSVRAPVGDLNLAYENCCIGRGLAALHSNNGCQAYLTFQMDMLRPQFELFNAQGTVFGCINKDALHSMKIILPPQHLQYKFEELVSPMEKHIRDNYTETCNLQVTRDTLLPKLMSGEIDVSEVEV
jgi:type I restriction enzyme S subunit